MIPKDWAFEVNDLKDCFFTIPLTPQDKEKFLFTVPTINNESPSERYQWKVLPQGRLNSSNMCQYHVHRVIQPVRDKWPQAKIIIWVISFVLILIQRLYVRYLPS